MYMFKKIFLGLMVAVIAMPFGASAASLPISVWIPYWKDDAGVKEAAPHLKPIWELNPFSYEVQNGAIVDLVGIDDIMWQDFWLDAKAEKVKMVPTIAWHDGDAIFATLSSSTTRADHVSQILAHVDQYKYDGVDIDYESKTAETAPYFSAFIKELGTALHARKKTLSCTIEPRTPLESRFKVIPPPSEIQYVNDYTVLNQYCDEVKVMTYDQRNVDIKLNESKGTGRPYLPVADKDWVEKVIKETTKTISPKKVMLGVATFGYEYEVALVPGVNGGAPTSGYNRLRSITYKDFTDIRNATGAPVIRNLAGEASAIYLSGSSIRLAWIPDASAIAEKVALAKKYKLRGVSVFSVNGENDPAMWSVLK
jgi:spore germination protein YaaH